MIFSFVGGAAFKKAQQVDKGPRLTPPKTKCHWISWTIFRKGSKFTKMPFQKKIFLIDLWGSMTLLPPSTASDHYSVAQCRAAPRGDHGRAAVRGGTRRLASHGATAVARHPPGWAACNTGPVRPLHPGVLYSRDGVSGGRFCQLRPLGRGPLSGRLLLNAGSGKLALLALILVRVKEDLAAFLVAIPKDVWLVHAADPAVVVVEPAVRVNAVHVGGVVARMGGDSVVTDHAHQTVCAVAGQVHGPRWLVAVHTKLGQPHLFGGRVGRLTLLQVPHDGLLQLTVLVHPCPRQLRLRVGVGHHQLAGGRRGSGRLYRDRRGVRTGALGEAGSGEGDGSGGDGAATCFGSSKSVRVHREGLVHFNSGDCGLSDIIWHILVERERSFGMPTLDRIFLVSPPRKT